MANYNPPKVMLNNQYQKYQENLLKATEILADKMLNEVKFDKTEICNVISQDEDDKSCYWVTNEAGLKYQAYSLDNKIYSKGKQVYVLVPQGNYELRKVITGQYETKEEQVSLYINPFDKLIIRNKFLFTPSNFFIIASNEDMETFKNFNIDNEISSLSGFKDFDYLAIEFTATTGFDDINSGEFYIYPQFLDSNGRTLLGEEDQKKLVYKSSQIFGNPYQLTSNLKIQHLFYFPKQLNITQINLVRLVLGTDGNFNCETSAHKKIIINSFNIYFGYDTNNENILSDKVVIDYNNSLIYSNSNRISLYADWRNLNYSNIFNYDLPSLDDNYSVCWLQYQAGYEKTQQTLEPNGIDINNELTQAYWKTVKYIETSDSGAFYFNFKPNIEKPTESFKVAIRKYSNDPEKCFYLESEPIVFINENKVQDPLTNQGVPDTLKLSIIGKGDNIFNNYGIDNKSFDGIYKYYEIQAEYINGFTWQPNLQDVIWKIPAQSSLITIPQLKDANGNVILDPDWSLDSNGKYYINTEGSNNQVHFSINRQFNYAKTNNTITCEIIRYTSVSKDVILDKFQGKLNLQFGTQGSSGTTYAFNIYPKKLEPIVDDNTSLSFKAVLENDKGEEVPLEDSNVKWEFLYYNEETTHEEITGVQYSFDKSELVDNLKVNLYCIILKATLNGQNMPKFTSYYPIPYCPLSQYTSIQSRNFFIEGDTRIVYDYQGTNPSISSENYKLFNYLYQDGSQALPNITWKIWFSEQNNNYSNIQISNLSYNYPSIEKDKNNNYKLRPLANIPTTIKPCSVIGLQGNIPVYVQPLIILQNTYAFPYLNSWDESTYIDVNEGTIMSQFIGAGYKNSNNQYTGVLMGTVEKAGVNTAAGVYGLQNGELRFKLDENGAFYVGRMSSSQNDAPSCYISFNEDIQGRSSDGELKIQVTDFVLNSNNLTINSLAMGTQPVIYFRDSDNDRDIFKICADGTGIIGGWQFTNEYITSDSNNKFYMGTTPLASATIGSKTYDNIIFKIGDKFGIDINGTMYAVNIGEVFRGIFNNNDFELSDGGIQFQNSGSGYAATLDAEGISWDAPGSRHGTLQWSSLRG